jgi:hypothetical protein
VVGDQTLHDALAGAQDAFVLGRIGDLRGEVAVDLTAYVEHARAPSSTKKRRGAAL